MESSPNEASNSSSSATSKEPNPTSVNDAPNPTSTTNSSVQNVDEETSEFESKKRQKTSPVWAEFKVVVVPDGSEKSECIHCKAKLSILASRSTSHFKRHLNACLK